MRLKFSPEFQGLFELIRGEVKEGCQLYLVGGAVRDAFLDRDIHDLDFAMDGDPASLARQLGRRLGVSFFMLDDERRTARVLFHTAGGQLAPLDFVQFTGGGLEEDLLHRDYTINAMAVSLEDFTQVIDPLGGQADLAISLLRPCSDQALLDDPVRVLRGIRIALQFDLQMSKDLPALMRAAASKLPLTSYERQRDEFFKILEGPHPGQGMHCCHQYDVFTTLIPALSDQDGIPASAPHILPLIDHTIASVSYYALLLDRIRTGEKEGDSPWWLSYAVDHLADFSSEVSAFFAEEITLGRSKKALALLGTLLHDIGKPGTMSTGEDNQRHYYGHAQEGASLARGAARRLQLSNTEAAWVETMVRHQMDLLPLVNKNQPLSRRAIYRFFQNTAEVGVALGLLTLADALATYGETITPEKWTLAVQAARTVFSSWWESQESVVSPKLLLDGNDLQSEFGLEPGQHIGQLLEALKEAQAVGTVSNLDEAKAFIHSQLNPKKGG